MKDLGTLEGKLLLFGGVYSNLQALEKLMKLAGEEGVEPSNIICTGDIVGYCAQPEETVNLFREWGVHAIAGNVEQNLREGGLDCGCEFKEGGRCESFAKNWYPYAQVNLSQGSVDWMETLPLNLSFHYHGKRVVVVHGSYYFISEYIFRSTPWSIKQKNFEDTKADIIVAGHCGLPFSDEQNDKLWLNPGVIGMPANDGTPRVWYAIMDKVNGDIYFEHRSFTFNADYTHDLMMRKHLPDAYAETLLTGLWDNNEILPREETERQGEAIEF
ncbi:MAG TPA: diadenosine tetraphosphatase [Cryomorphaceae bacterium]|nr:diadenosine tetraphosphatase [Owenweeksia sp.]MBF98903.1 diadenosine tetraphosphatase [Owenweeksia sp.]HAD98403.1 diadenosine tetraphosphatase [Cryomorphaceae bacterium]HBF21241.1 diadenosine tetraphosphatase [Cryomorphaceae bacterium]HCQ17059.1 diadenosine tetraphosphatase [Cryomorphaceae bacterium]